MTMLEKNKYSKIVSTLFIKYRHHVCTLYMYLLRKTLLKYPPHLFYYLVYDILLLTHHCCYTKNYAIDAAIEHFKGLCHIHIIKMEIDVYGSINIFDFGIDVETSKFVEKENFVFSSSFSLIDYNSTWKKRYCFSLWIGLFE